MHKLYHLQPWQISMRQLRSRNVEQAHPSSHRPTNSSTKRPKLQSLSWMGVRQIICRRFKKKRLDHSHKSSKKISMRRLGKCLQEEELLCMICLQHMLAPTTLTCGHAFCLRCIHRQSTTASTLRCALCRLPDHSSFHEPNPHLENMVAVKLWHSDLETERAYQRRQCDPLHVKRRVARVLVVGEEVRVRKLGAGEQWREGSVEEVVKKSGTHFYRVKIEDTDERVLLPERTVNMNHAEVFPYIFFPRPSASSFNFNPLPELPYNVESLMWDVGFQPQSYNMWMGEVGGVALESESVQYLGRRMPSLDPEIIEID